MTTFLFVRGLDPITLHDSESFNKVRARINQAKTGTNHLGEPDPKAKKTPLHKLTFHTEDGGRCSFDPEHVIGCGSDEWSDKDAQSEDDDE